MAEQDEIKGNKISKKKDKAEVKKLEAIERKQKEETRFTQKTNFDQMLQDKVMSKKD